MKIENKTEKFLKCIKIVNIEPQTNFEVMKNFQSNLNVSTKEVKHGKCSVCDKEKKLKLSLECGCNYCHLCKDNYYQNGNKCFCPEKEEN